MQTEQLNVRMSEDLVHDIDIVTGLLKINRSEWIKAKLAEEAQKEKTRLLMELSTLYAKGMIKKSDIEKLVGKEIADRMESTLETADKSIGAVHHYVKRRKGKFHS